MTSNDAEDLDQCILLTRSPLLSSNKASTRSRCKENRRKNYYKYGQRCITDLLNI